MVDITLKNCDRCGCDIRSPPDLAYGLKIEGGDPLWGNLRDLCEPCKSAIENFISIPKGHFWSSANFTKEEIIAHEAKHLPKN